MNPPKKLTTSPAFMSLFANNPSPEPFIVDNLTYENLNEKSNYLRIGFTGCLKIRILRRE